MAGPIDRLRSTLGRLAEPSEGLLQRMRAFVGQRQAKTSSTGGLSHSVEDVVGQLKELGAKSASEAAPRP